MNFNQVLNGLKWESVSEVLEKNLISNDTIRGTILETRILHLAKDLQVWLRGYEENIRGEAMQLPGAQIARMCYVEQGFKHLMGLHLAIKKTKRFQQYYPLLCGIMLKVLGDCKLGDLNLFNWFDTIYAIAPLDNIILRSPKSLLNRKNLDDIYTTYCQSK